MSASKLNLYWRVQLAAHHMQKYADRELASAARISTAQVGVLTVIANSNEINQKGVATALGLNESAVTAMVKRLVALKYVDCRKNKADGRVKTLSLTPLGEDVQRHTKLPFKKINKVIESTLAADEIEILADCLERLRQSFEENT
ncbi:MAG: DNA-binding MarR family transcriptional regulator [Candidatus Azotimanducaceae bacterium]|jgi:DNA-binding MarR family transcriptional regulator